MFTETGGVEIGKVGPIIGKFKFLSHFITFGRLIVFQYKRNCT